MLPVIVGAAIVGGILYLVTKEEKPKEDQLNEEENIKKQKLLESQKRITELRRELRHQLREKRKLLPKDAPPENGEDESTS